MLQKHCESGAGVAREEKNSWQDTSNICESAVGGSCGMRLLRHSILQASCSLTDTHPFATAARRLAAADATRVQTPASPLCRAPQNYPVAGPTMIAHWGVVGGRGGRPPPPPAPQTGIIGLSLLSTFWLVAILYFHSFVHGIASCMSVEL
jgi:hypothetical protein